MKALNLSAFRHQRGKRLLWTVLMTLTSFSLSAVEIDNRETLVLQSDQRMHVLGEMREMLSGVQGIVAALAQEDMQTAAEHARMLGTGMGKKAEDKLHAILPPAFLQLGMSVHRDFDRIADDAITIKDPKHTLQQLATTMKTCEVCHAAYQIRLQPE